MALPDPPPQRRRNTGEITVGVIVGALGMLLLADRYLDRDVLLTRSWWPLFLIAMGAVRLATAGDRPDGRPRTRGSGGWLMMVGAWALVSESHLFGLTFATSWPLLVMGAGVMMVWRWAELSSSSPWRKSRVAPRRVMPPAAKARRARIPPVFERGATPAPGTQHSSNAAGLAPRAAGPPLSREQ